MSGFRPPLIAVALLVLAVADVSAQPPSSRPATSSGAAQIGGRTAGPPARRLTTLDALRQFPGYYHLQNVLLAGEFGESGSRIAFRSDESDMRVMLASDTRTTGGQVEVRAQLIDVGRLEPGDARLAGYDGPRDTERWPRPGEELLLNITAVIPSQPAVKPSIRSLALEPWRFEGQSVTLVGQFRGLNLFGDLPSAPAKSKYDFVLRGPEASVWVTGMRPRSKGLDLDVNARVDTNRWVQVTGVVKQERGLVTIEATRIAPALEPSAEPVVEEPDGPPVPLAPLEVVFSSPTAAEADVPGSSAVRVQFSRGLDPASIPGHFTVSYIGPAPTAGEPLPPIEFKVSYDAAARAVELRFAKPLERFQTVKVDVIDGLKAFDGGLVTPWSLTFSIGE